MVADRRPASVGGQRLSPDTRRPASELPVTPLLGRHLTVHHTRHMTVDTEWRRPDSSASPFATRSATPYSKQLSPNESRPWTRDSLAALSSSPTRAATADGRRGTRKTSWPINPELSRPNSRSPEMAHQSLMPLPRLAAQHGSPLFEDVWQSPLLEAEVELHAAPHATHEERGLLAVRLLSALASQSSPFQPLLTRCVEALRPCVFVRGATDASATSLERGAAASEDITHMSMSAKLRAEVAELRRHLHSSREAFDQARQMLLAEHDAHAACKLKLAGCQLREDQQAESEARLRAQAAAQQAALELVRENMHKDRERGDARAEAERLRMERLLEDALESKWEASRTTKSLQARPTPNRPQPPPPPASASASASVSASASALPSHSPPHRLTVSSGGHGRHSLARRVQRPSGATPAGTRHGRWRQGREGGSHGAIPVHSLRVLFCPPLSPFSLSPPPLPFTPHPSPPPHTPHPTRHTPHATRHTPHATRPLPFALAGEAG